MKIQIRRGVFETNSSSTHSITMCSEEEYNKFKNGEMWIDWNNCFLTKDEIIDKLKKKRRDIDFNNLSSEEVYILIQEYVEDTDNELRDYESYWEDEYLEGYEDSYITKSGEKVIAFGKYGYEG